MPIVSTVEPWQERSREQVFKKYSRKIEKVIFALPDGTESDFYLKAEGEPVCIFALTSDQRVVLAEQFRPGPNQVLFELPGGGRETNETVEQAALRELQEETGFTGTIYSTHPLLDCAYSSMKRHAVIILNATQTHAPSPDRQEWIKIHTHSLSGFRTLLRSGQMTDIEVGYRCLDELNLL